VGLLSVLIVSDNIKVIRYNFTLSGCCTVAAGDSLPALIVVGLPCAVVLSCAPAAALCSCILFFPHLFFYILLYSC
jgi:hypothetical protein